MEDADLLYIWRNEDECRKNSVNTGYIEYKEHCKWLAGKLNSDTCNIFICIKEHNGSNKPVGQVRVDYVKYRYGEISYSIGKEYRCNGYGTKILKLIEGMKEIKANVDKLCAIVKTNNLVSQKCFENLGYVKSVKKDLVYYNKSLIQIYK